MAELRECPFCGGEAEMGTASSAFGKAGWSVHCANIDQCPAEWRIFKHTRAAAVAAWNARAPGSSMAPTLSATLKRTFDFINRLPIPTPGAVTIGIEVKAALDLVNAGEGLGSSRAGEATKLVAELDAKAWQSMRYRNGRHRREEHVCYRAARLIEALAVDDTEEGA